MKPQTLPDLHNRFITHLRAGNRSEKTIIHYKHSFRDLLRYLEARNLPLTLDAITTESCQGFVTWLRETPTRVWRGKTTRSIHGLAGRLRDLKAFLHFLELEDILDHKESGIDIWTHRFRHTAASKLIQNGADRSYVRRIMGHSHIGTTLLYVHHDNADLREKHQAPSPLASIGLGGKPKRRRFTVD